MLSNCRHHLILSAAILALGSVTTGQSYVWSPPNTGTVSGGSNNTIPYWGVSATYQQIHHAATMAPTMSIKGIGMRPAGNRTVLGRSWDMRITMSHTSVAPINAGLDFATNLGAGNTTIAFGSATTWPTFSWPDFTTSGMTPAFTIPFAQPYVYIEALGNLCWEWRHKNGSRTTSMPMDASNASGQKGTVLASGGLGCTASGNTSPATAKLTPVQTASPAFQHHLEIRLANGASNANAFLALALASTTTQVPGWCAPVVTPVFLTGVNTDASGSFLLAEDLVKLAGTAPIDIHAQFAFADASLPSGLGLSDVAGYRTPAVPGAHGISRIYSYSTSTNGNETATTGTGSTRGYGLSVAWLQ